MAGDDEDKYAQYANIPIPTYDETTSSRPTSSQNIRDGDEAEREGLLGQRHDRYRPPTVESARTSLASDEDDDDDLRLPEVSGADHDRRQVEELDYLDPSEPDTSRRSPRLYHRVRLRRGAAKWSQHLSNLGATLSSIRLPSFRSLYRPVAATEDGPVPPTPDTRTWLFRMVDRLPTVPERYRISAPTFARLCGLFTLMALVYILFALDVFPGRGRFRGGGAHFDPEAVRVFILENTKTDNIQNMLSHITSFDHVAGTEGDLYLAKWMQDKWQEEGGMDEVATLPYYVYLNYPKPVERSIEIVKPEEKRWTAKLEEDEVYPDRQQTLAWHGHSKSGEVEGHLIYANGGSTTDFQYLQDHGVITNGSIALVKYGGLQPDRSLKVAAAEAAGCAGVLIYSDPGDVKPESAWQPPDDMLQRGGVTASSYVLGDPLTPGIPSTKDAKRLKPDSAPGLPQIPSLPLSWRDAKVLLESLSNRGEAVPKTWIHGPQTGFTKEWYTGTAGDDALMVHLKNLNDENSHQQIWNVHGMIEGLETPKKKVIVGNHRDAWCFGSVDPGSGSAVMMEVVRLFGELRQLGWRPLRTIEFVSWDAEEYNFVGSTEYVEEHSGYLREHGVAYLNVDAGVFGDLFHAAGSPVWQPALMHVLDRISDPTSNGTRYLKQVWEQASSQFDGLGAGSDYVAFQDMVGTSSIDLGFVKGLGADQEYYPYHSCHETMEWLETYGDPDFSYHTTLAQVWALLILELADRPLLPYDLRVYSEKLGNWVGELERQAASLYATQKKLGKATVSDLEKATNFTLQPLKDAIGEMRNEAETFHRWEDVWTSNVLGAGGLETTQFALKRREYNDRLAKFETYLLDFEKSAGFAGTEGCPEGGIPGRCQFKHIVFGPDLVNGYGASYFPFVRDAMQSGDWTAARGYIERAAARIRDAAGKLVE